MSAHTYTLVSNEVDGSVRKAAYIVSASTTASGAVDTPIGWVQSAKISPLSCASVGFGIIVKANQSSAGATKSGSVFVSSCTSGDVFFLTVYGKA